MGRFIVRYTGRGPAPQADLARIRSAPDVTVLDSSAPRMLLVEAPPQAVSQLTEALPGWVWTQEQMVPLPDPRPKVRSP
jgi:hypothetical protein